MRKQRDIASAIRRGIVRGRWRPGARIPTVRELTARFAAGLPTVHRALRELAAQGFLEADGRNGTRVAAHPPHRCRFALVLPDAPGRDGVYASLMHRAQAAAAAGISRPDRTLAVHHGLGPHPELPAHRLLARACAEQRLAGLIIEDPSRVAPWLDPAALGLPVVAPAGTPGATACTVLDQWQVVERALTAAAAAGCRRLAYLGTASAHALDYVPGVRRRAAALGLDLPHRRIAAASVACPGWAAQAMRGFWDADGGAPPQAVVVLDDNLADAACAALREMSAEPLILQLTNWPAPAPSWRRLVRLGWDQRVALALCLDHLSGGPGGEIRPPLRVEEPSTGSG